MHYLKGLAAGVLALAGLAAVAQQPNPLAPAPTRPTAETPATSAPTPAAAGQPQLTPQDVNAWLDGFIPYALASGDIAGGVVVIVHNGQVIAQRGYGFADVARRTPVDPARTLFRPGSVSKLFTWTAVMQQVEQGRLDLDADVNRYLDFEIPPYEGRPITLRNIMTHTAGFEEAIKGLISTRDSGASPYEDLLKEWIPHRVFASGTTPAYSNYATSLAGYIVQRVSGEPFDTYVERHIFAPLGMANSTFRQPLPPRLRPMMATGYQLASGEPVGFEHVGARPAGSLSATGADMARFMIAHLNGGQPLLRPETARLMHTTAARGVGPLNRMMLGFYETDINGHQGIGHGGDTIGFHSDLQLFPDDDVGIFVSFNSGGREGAVHGLRSAIVEEFADRYFPAPADTRRVDAATARQHAELLAGTWTNSRGAFTSFMNILDLFGQVKTSVDAEGRPVVPFLNGLNGQPRTWVEVQPFVWRDLNSHERLAAQVENGRVVRFSVDTIAPFMVFDRTPWYLSSAWLVPALLVSLAILFLTALFWPVRALVRRRFGATLALEKRDLTSYRLVRGAAWLILLVLIGWAVTLITMMGDFNNLSPGFDPIIYVLQSLSFVAFLGGLAVMLWDAWLIWRGNRGWKAKVWSLALVFAAFIIVWIGFAFNLLSLGANY
ncbi:serine hydrolase domain-containing protein [Sphingosinicella sp. LHD-64]|uniref:serine hydrolase domain-containing protein n=1 Tax=Sphingosinicella sp. LHD-64 TaxID=3072139 RepID=UPI00280FAD42|nr:serine hydrolase domain-containing protein [Sphingosinicella sp. LHD-64]MDQ8756600.1 serine hydrolase domain-containing protein [Sphingosinicella sp. LHD-64]